MLTKPRRRYKNRAAFRTMNPAPGGENRLTRRTPITATDLVISGLGPSTATITFDQSIILNGIPQYASNTGALPTGASQTAPDTIVLNYAGAPSNLTIPFEDPGVRNMAAGYVIPTEISPG